MKEIKNPEQQRVSTITCPECGEQTTEVMPVDSCQYFWQCPHCEEVLKALEGDCCVYCSYGDTDCPSMQNEECC